MLTRPRPAVCRARAAVCSAILAGLLATTGAAHAAQDALERAIKQAENEVGESGSAAAAARAKAFARNICQNFVPRIANAADAERFVGHYDQLQRERVERVSKVAPILRDTPADAEGRDLVEEGIRMALLLQDAQAEVDACIRQRRKQLGLPDQSQRNAVPLLTVPPALSQGTSNKKFCDRYAKSAQSQQEQNTALKCGFIGGRWQDNYDNHYDWCMRARADVVNSETKIRSAHLKQCSSNARKNTGSLCDTYARNAQSQQQENVRRGCGYRGGRWQANYDSHFNWCMRARYAAVNNEHKARIRQLQTCGE